MHRGARRVVDVGDRARDGLAVEHGASLDPGPGGLGRPRAHVRGQVLRGSSAVGDRRAFDQNLWAARGGHAVSSEPVGGDPGTHPPRRARWRRSVARGEDHGHHGRTAGRARRGRLPLHASAVGKVLLAHSSPDFQERVLSGPLIGYTPATIVTAETLRLELARVRRDGVATSEDELTPGSTSCAALATGPAEMGMAAISILGTTGARDLREMKILVQTAGRGLTHALAGPGPGNRSARGYPGRSRARGDTRPPQSGVSRPDGVRRSGSARRWSWSPEVARSETG
ncbi:hypothetical protein FXW78_21495 [Rhodococcus opacus]|nr:hypothetical protein [Rhodococcus opacus]